MSRRRSGSATEAPVSPSNPAESFDASDASSAAVMTLRQQRAAAWVIAICIVVMASDCVLSLARRERRIEIDRSLHRRTVELTIDLNQATWPELTLLPEISETMARRIVEFREREGRFEALDELQQVPGIGPRTFERVRPYLQPIPSAPVTVARH